MTKEENDERKEVSSNFEQRSVDSLDAIEKKLDKLNGYASQIATWTHWCAAAALIYMAAGLWHWYKA